jgi:hypothetical protein
MSNNAFIKLDLASDDLDNSIWSGVAESVGLATSMSQQRANQDPRNMAGD